MRIAQVSPLFESVPPKLYGGTERIVSYLTEELVKHGHDVTLFASGDSVTSARLESQCERALRLDDSYRDQVVPHVIMLERLFSQVAEFDLVHFHIDYLHFPLSRLHKLKHVTTMHGRLDSPEIVSLLHEYSEMPVISISDAQRQPVPQANWQATVYHGIPEDLLCYHSGCGQYLAFLGRVSPEKGLGEAIKIAKKADMNLKIAAKVGKIDQEYFDEVIKPSIDGHSIEFLGEIGEKDKSEFLGNALAMLFPIKWPEPFGIAMIEAMACGTPTIAYRAGSVPEVIDEGATGYIVDDVDQAVDALRKTESFDRKRCRGIFERKFTASRMAGCYLSAYQKVLESPKVHASAK